MQSVACFFLPPDSSEVLNKFLWYFDYLWPFQVCNTLHQTNIDIKIIYGTSSIVELISENPWLSIATLVYWRPINRKRFGRCGAGQQFSSARCWATKSMWENHQTLMLRRAIHHLGVSENSTIPPVIATKNWGKKNMNQEFFGCTSFSDRPPFSWLSINLWFIKHLGTTLINKMEDSGAP